MKEWVNGKLLKKSLVCGTIVSIGMFLGACSSPEVLENNGNVPAPSLVPPPNANQLSANDLQTQNTPMVVTEQPETVLHATTIVPSYQTTPSQPSNVTYTVKKGDSLWKISRMFGTTVKALAENNGLVMSATLRIGTVLTIPAGGLHVPRAGAKHSYGEAKGHASYSANHSSKGNYVVQKGDSLWLIAKRHGISTKSLAEANQLTTKSVVRVGQKLIIPGAKNKHVSKKSRKVKVASESKHQNDNKAPVAKNSEADTGVTNSPASSPSVSEEPASTKAQSTLPSQDIEQATPSASYLPHTVRDGDTWQSISDMYGLTIDNLKKANPTVTGAEPKSGIVINIPEE